MVKTRCRYRGRYVVRLDFGLIVTRTLDVGACLEVLTNPDIFESISEDGATEKDLKIDVQNHIWLEIFEDENLIGVVQFKPMFTKCFEAHIHILPEYRKESKEAGRLICNWLKENLSETLIYTTIPIICENVKNYLMSFGFKQVGYLEKAFSKNNKLVDMWIYSRRF